MTQEPRYGFRDTVSSETFWVRQSTDNIRWWRHQGATQSGKPVPMGRLINNPGPRTIPPKVWSTFDSAQLRVGVLITPYNSKGSEKRLKTYSCPFKDLGARALRACIHGNMSLIPCHRICIASVAAGSTALHETHFENKSPTQMITLFTCH